MSQEGGTTYDGKSRGSESRFEPALLLEPLLPGVLVLYTFFAGDEDDGKWAGLDEPAEISDVNGRYGVCSEMEALTRKQRCPVSPRCAIHSNSTAGDYAANRCARLR